MYYKHTKLNNIYIGPNEECEEIFEPSAIRPNPILHHSTMKMDNIY